MRYLLLLLFLAACTTAPTTYSQGAPMPPRAPAFEPAWDAPSTTGHPGYLDPEPLPRSPHSRVLPETPDTRREPGLWAGDEPMASAEHDPDTLIEPLLGIPTLIAPSNNTPEGLELTNFCVMSMNRALNDAKVRRWAMDLPMDFRRCLAARLFDFCGEAMLEGLAKGIAAHGRAAFDAAEIARIVLLRDTGKEFVKLACPDVPGSKDADRIFEKTTKAWRKRQPE